jgi:hypothetical protein
MEFLNIDWTAENRLEKINAIMAFSPRDWSLHDACTATYKDKELWAIWCLSCCKTKAEAIKSWNGFINET